MNASDVIKAMKNFQWDDLDYDNIKLFEKNIIVLLRPNGDTVPIGTILGVKNARAWVSMVSYLKK